jgi:hypothetical protein
MNGPSYTSALIGDGGSYEFLMVKRIITHFGDALQQRALRLLRNGNLELLGVAALGRSIS